MELPSPLLELFILAVRNDRLHAMKMRENYRRHLPRRAHACESFEYEVVAADASGDLGYIVGWSTPLRLLVAGRRSRIRCG